MSVESFEEVLRRLKIGPRMTEMMDKLAISTPSGSVSAHQETFELEEQKLHVFEPSDANCQSPSRDVTWLDPSHSSDHTCEFCGYRAPHSQLKMFHSRSHLNEQRLEKYAKVDSISQMVADIRSIKLDSEHGQPYCGEAAVLLNRRKHRGRKMRARLDFYKQREARDMTDFR